jgi:hypothetical protein
LCKLLTCIRFTEANAELVILYLSHPVDARPIFDPKWVESRRGEPLNNDELWFGVLERLKRLDHRFMKDNIDSQFDLTNLPLNAFIGNGTASVLVITENFNKIPPGQGFYSSSNFPHFDSWSEKNKEREMADDQLKKLHDNTNFDPSTPDKDQFHILSWTLTEQWYEAIGLGSIETIAMAAYDPLFWRAYAAFSPKAYPSVLYMDYFGQSESRGKEKNDVMAFAIAVNVAIASQNCWVVSGGN